MMPESHVSLQTTQYKGMAQFYVNQPSVNDSPFVEPNVWNPTEWAFRKGSSTHLSAVGAHRAGRRPAERREFQLCGS